MGQDQLLLAMIFLCIFSGGLGFFGGYCIGYKNCVEMFYKKYKFVKKDKE